MIFLNTEIGKHTLSIDETCTRKSDTSHRARVPNTHTHTHTHAHARTHSSKLFSCTKLLY